MWTFIRPRPGNLRIWQLALLAALITFWHVMTAPGLIPPMMFENDRQAAFFFGEPAKVALRIWDWFVTDADIYRHLGITLLETLLAFGIGAVAGLGCGLWLALQPMASALLEPYVKALNSMPRIILAPIFAVWFGLGIGSKVALGVTLVFFIVFFNVYQGVKEVSPVVLANARMLGASSRQLLRHVYRRVPPAGSSPACTPAWAWPSSAPWWASTSAPARAWATSSSRPRAPSTSTP